MFLFLTTILLLPGCIGSKTHYIPLQRGDGEERLFLLPSAESAVCTDRWRSPLNTRAAGKGGDGSGKISCFRGPGKQLHQHSYSQNYNPRESLESKLLKYLLVFSFPNALILVLETLPTPEVNAYIKLCPKRPATERVPLKTLQCLFSNEQRATGGSSGVPTNSHPAEKMKMQQSSQTLPPKFLLLPCLLLEGGCDEQSGCA